RIGIGEYLKLLYRFHPQQHSTHRPRRLAIDVVNVRTIEQKTVLFRSRSVDRDLLPTSTHHVASRRGCCLHSVLDHSQPLEPSSVQRQVFHLRLLHRAAQLARDQVDRRRLSRYHDYVACSRNFELEIHYGILTHGKRDGFHNHRLKSRHAHAHVVPARHKQRLAV